MRIWIEDQSALAVHAPSPPKQAVRVAAGVPGKPPAIDLIQVQSSDTSNLNQSDGHVIVWEAPATLARGTALELSDDGTALVAQAAGIYETRVQVAQGNLYSQYFAGASGEGRTNAGVYLHVNEERAAPWGLAGYIRNASAHAESSVSARRFVDLQKGDRLSVECQQEANAGPVYLIPDGTLFEMQRLGD